MSPMLVIAKREFRSYFDSPLAYVVICLSFVVFGVFFFWINNFWQINQATMQPLFEATPIGLSALVIPVVTMRLIAEEKRSGTLEMLITLPVRDSDVVLGKYLGALALIGILLLASMLYPLTMFQWPWNLGPIDMGPVLSGYLGLLLFCGASVAIGLLVSALTESQAVAFFITLTVLVAFWVTGYLAEETSGAPANILNYLSFQTRLNGFVRGLIDTRDVIYFLSVTGLALIVAFRALERRKWA